VKHEHFILQVESGLEVSFQLMGSVANQTDRFLPVGWAWRAGASTPLAVCEMVSEAGAGDTPSNIRSLRETSPLPAVTGRPLRSRDENERY